MDLFGLTFTAPQWLLLLPVFCVLTIWLSRRMRGLSRAQRNLALGFRCLGGALLIAALAGPEIRLVNRGQAVAFVLDVSDSVPSADQKRALEFVDSAMRKLGAEDRGSVVVAGAQPILESAAGPSRPIPALTSRVDRGSSQLASALRLGIASLPVDRNRRVVLLTDGNETLGDLAQAAEAAAAEGVAVDVVALGSGRERAEAYVAGLTPPPDARVGAKAALRARVVSDRPMTARLTLDRDGVVRATRTVRLNAGENSVLFEEPVLREGTSQYRVTLESDEDTDVRNNSGLAVLNARGPSSTLLIEATPAPSPLAQALTGRGVRLRRVGPSQVPVTVSAFAGYDGIILNDVNASLISEGQMKAIQSAIRDAGVGFVMVGGENSFLPGGYFGTPIAEALPVDLNLRQRKDLPSTSILIMVDCSGSMSLIEDGLPKLELAKKAAEVTATLLGPQDRLAVAGSSDGIEFVVPFGPLRKQEAIEGIRSLDVTGGGIYIGPSVEAADQALRREPSKIRHLLLLADGADSTDWRDAMARVPEMRRQGITTSVIAFGQGEYVNDLRRLAALGGGRFYLTEKARQLPAIFSQDAAIISRSAIEEGAFLPKQTGNDAALQGLDQLPPLLAYCLTDTRPMSRVALRTQKDDPLLAKWQYGLGTSVAFTSDAAPRWAQRWVGWEGFDVFWSQLVRGMSRRATQTQFETQLVQEGADLLVRVSAPEGGEPSSLRVSGPSGDAQSLNLQPVAPGVFEARFKASKVGSYVVSVVENTPTGSLVQVDSFSRAYPAEYQSASANEELLSQVVQVTGGRMLTRPEEAAQFSAKNVVTAVEAWFWCLLLACALWPLDVASRRLVLRKLSFRRAPAMAPQVEAISRLKAAKLRGSAPRPSATVAPRMGAEVPKAQPGSEQSSRPTSTGAKNESAAERLLEQKRKRRQNSGEDQL